jgi:hypothetical protein
MLSRQWNGRGGNAMLTLARLRFLVVLLVGMSAVAVARPEHLNPWPPGGTRVVCSLDHLIGAGEQRRRHGEGEQPRGLGVDHQFELGRPHNRQVCGLGTVDWLQLTPTSRSRPAPFRCS